jgi:hypothetical protein
LNIQDVMAVLGAGSTGIGLLVLILYFFMMSAKKINKIDKVAVVEDRLNHLGNMLRWIEQNISELQMETSHRKREILACHARVDKLFNKEKEDARNS